MTPGNSGHQAHSDNLETPAAGRQLMIPCRGKAGFAEGGATEASEAA